MPGAHTELPVIPAYSVSKAAAFSLTQSLRALLAGRGVRVHAVLAGPVDTDMTRGLEIPEASREPAARAISTPWKTARRTSSPVPCRHPWPMPGTTGQPKPSSARTLRSYHQSLSPHKGHGTAHGERRGQVWQGDTAQNS
jgi:NAD(P)-dependent dehydrogenase (short-subunit alcohol dehydrogenase family)